jgi:hypothetical protein
MVGIDEGLEELLAPGREDEVLERVVVPLNFLDLVNVEFHC